MASEELSKKLGRIKLIKLNRERIAGASKRAKSKRNLGALEASQFVGKKEKDPAKLAVRALDQVSFENETFGFKDPIRRKMKDSVLKRIREKLLKREKSE